MGFCTACWLIKGIGAPLVSLVASFKGASTSAGLVKRGILP
jgi:hypothetical protein